MSSRSPASRFSREHGTGYGMKRRKTGKRVYRSWWRARLSCWKLNRRYRDTLHVYSCYWGADYRTGETAEKHYHLGHEGQHDMWGY